MESIRFSAIHLVSPSQSRVRTDKDTQKTVKQTLFSLKERYETASKLEIPIVKNTIIQNILESAEKWMKPTSKHLVAGTIVRDEQSGQLLGILLTGQDARSFWNTMGLLPLMDQVEAGRRDFESKRQELLGGLKSVKIAKIRSVWKEFIELAEVFFPLQDKLLQVQKSESAKPDYRLNLVEYVRNNPERDNESGEPPRQVEV